MTDSPLILWLDDPAANGSPLLGGKFASLTKIMDAGFAVPPGFGVTTEAYRHFMTYAGLVELATRIRAAALGTELSEIKRLTADLTAAIGSAPLPEDLDAAIRASYARLEQATGRADVPVVVRSSGESEDLAGASFAGQYDTYLWISGADAVVHNMRACWASMFGEAVLSYRHDGEATESASQPAICVGIQQMVEARSAGVMFTLDPLNGDLSKIVMEACWGLGEGMVKGDVTPSRFTLDKVSFEIIKRETAPQPEEYRFDPAANAVRLLPVPTERQQAACLSDPEVVALAQLAKQIEGRRNAPQDIEWAIGAEGEIRILQVRPETVWSQREQAGLIKVPTAPIDHVLQRLSGIRVAKAPAGKERS